ncbi:MAG TPA: LysR family transcriptional regulator [Usitatibacter sp.]|jgi:DNA-binding transcriptional LysR family regulator|nr:LysR family transcriptional regulator [Usitatibacter sp.]
MDLEKARVFVRVAQCGSLTKAAALHGVLQSVVSRQVTGFERECGGRLFHRTGRGVTLSELGERILPRVRDLVNQADLLTDELHGTAHVPVGEVRVGILPSLANPLVTTLYRAVREKLPRVSLRIYEGAGGQLEEWIVGGRVDVAVLFPPTGAPRSQITALRRVSMYLVGPPRDPLTRAPSVPFAKLDGLPLVLPAPPSALRAVLELLARRKRIDLKVALEADSLYIQKDLVADRGGHGILAFHAVHREVKQGLLQAARITHPAINRTIAIETTRQHPLTLASREVSRLLRHTIESMPLIFAPDHERSGSQR